MGLRQSTTGTILNEVSRRDHCLRPLGAMTISKIWRDGTKFLLVLWSHGCSSPATHRLHRVQTNVSESCLSLPTGPTVFDMTDVGPAKTGERARIGRAAQQYSNDVHSSGARAVPPRRRCLAPKLSVLRVQSMPFWAGEPLADHDDSS